MKNYEVLEATAALLEEKGWCQGKFYDDTGAKCLTGALPTKHTGAYRAFQKHVGTTDYLSYWNDEPGRTAIEVISELRACAKALKEGSVG